MRFSFYGTGVHLVTRPGHGPAQYFEVIISPVESPPVGLLIHCASQASGMSHTGTSGQVGASLLCFSSFSFLLVGFVVSRFVLSLSCACWSNVFLLAPLLSLRRITVGGGPLACDL